MLMGQFHAVNSGATLRHGMGVIPLFDRPVFAWNSPENAQNRFLAPFLCYRANNSIINLEGFILLLRQLQRPGRLTQGFLIALALLAS